MKILDKFTATVELIIKPDANRSTIHDEVSTILRANKCKDLTVQMTSVGGITEAIEIEASASPVKRVEARTEDDLDFSHDS